MRTFLLRLLGAVPLCAFIAFMAGAHIDSAEWEKDNHCVAVGETAAGIYPTNPVRTKLGCDCGFYWRSTR